ncbi:transposase family protein [Streptomyces sp. NPDC001928]|uniref:transposase family protein n=1 Tax=Streptomyces sp. NPDC001928 TaxID=3154404 RepID=UPI00332DD098
MLSQARAAMSHSAFCGLSEEHLAAGAGPKYGLVFVDRLLVTLVLADRGFAVPDHPGLQLRTLEDVFAYAEAESVTLRIDGMETQLRRPRAGRPGRRAFVWGKRKQNTIKTTTITDGHGRTLWSGAVRPGRMPDQPAMRTEGIAEQFRRHPTVKAQVDDRYRGLANEFPGQVFARPKKPKGPTR